MAKIKGTTESGKLGDRIYYSWHGKQCDRAMPTHVTNPQTEAQQSHRNAFAMISKLSSYMKEAHLVGLHWQALKEKNSSYAVFKHLNKGCFTADGCIDYPRVVVSSGTLTGASITSARIAEGVLTVAFDGHSSGNLSTDEFFLFVYCPAMNEGHLVQPVLRSAGEVAVELPPDWLGENLHLYAFLRARRGRTSNTIYHSLLA